MISIHRVQPLNFFIGKRIARRIYFCDDTARPAGQKTVQGHLDPAYKSLIIPSGKAKDMGGQRVIGIIPLYILIYIYALDAAGTDPVLYLLPQLDINLPDDFFISSAALYLCQNTFIL